MSVNAFEASLKESITFLKSINLYGANGTKNINKDGVSSEFKSASQQSNYLTVYQTAVRNLDFDFTLKDNSIFQFSYKEKKDIPEVRYAFFQNPKIFISYYEFLDIQRNLNLLDETNDEIGELYFEEYEQFLDEQQLNMSSITIRYDVDPKNYNPLIHSTSHIHIGHLNDIRIPCDKILSPLKFTIFVTKHIYYFIWKNFIESNNSNSAFLKTAKNGCPLLIDNYWKEHEFGIHENKELYLS